MFWRLNRLQHGTEHIHRSLPPQNPQSLGQTPTPTHFRAKVVRKGWAYTLYPELYFQVLQKVSGENSMLTDVV